MSAAARGMGRNITGAEYVSALTSRASDRRARAAFRARALERVPPGGLIYDFGAGPGLDARYYAERGRRVDAYDVEPQMRAYFADYCADLIAGGQVTLHGGTYAEFLAGGAPDGRAVDLVTANFAPLNLIDDLSEVFQVFARLTHRDGGVLASVLSPYFVGDLKYGWWWRNLAQLARRGRFAVEGTQARIWRRSLADFAAASSPYFVLERVFAGTSPGSGQADVAGVPATRRTAWLAGTRSRFIFLLFRKPAPPA